MKSWADPLPSFKAQDLEVLFIFYFFYEYLVGVGVCSYRSWAHGQMRQNDHGGSSVSCCKIMRPWREYLGKLDDVVMEE